MLLIYELFSTFLKSYVLILDLTQREDLLFQSKLRFWPSYTMLLVTPFKYILRILSAYLNHRYVIVSNVLQSHWQDNLVSSYSLPTMRKIFVG